MDRLHVATLNIRNLADRWAERLASATPTWRRSSPTCIGLQEVVYVLQQDRLIGAAGARGVRRGPGLGRAGPSTATACCSGRRSSATASERLDLGLGAVRPSRPRGACPAARRCSFAVTHLHHPPDAAKRSATSRPRPCWLARRRPAADATIVVGDFNADPDEPAYARITRGRVPRRRSSRRTAPSPPYTWPSGLQAPAMDTDGDPGCLDYIWVRGDGRASTTAGSPSTARPSTTRRSTRRTTSGWPPTSRSVVRSRVGRPRRSQGPADPPPGPPGRSSQARREQRRRAPGGDGQAGLRRARVRRPRVRATACRSSSTTRRSHASRAAPRRSAT